MCLERGENIEREQLECFGYGWVSMLWLLSKYHFLCTPDKHLSVALLGIGYFILGSRRGVNTL
jgi:hypothetical protein